MTESHLAIIRNLPRDQLEDIALGAAQQIRIVRAEVRAGDTFVAILTGFVLGAIVAAGGLLLGLGLR